MDIKRLLLALMLSFVFIIMWNVFFPPASLPDNSVLMQTENRNETKQNLQSKDLGSGIYKSRVKEHSEFYGATPIIITTPLVELELINSGTSIQNLKIVESQNNVLKHTGAWSSDGLVYIDEAPVELFRGAVCNPCLTINNQPVSFSLVSNTKFLNDNELNGYHVIEAVSTQNNSIIKKTIIYNNSYRIEHVFEGLPENGVALIWDAGLLPSEKLINDDMLYFSVYAQNKESYQEEYLSSINKKEVFEFDENVGWAGLKSKYFMKAVTNDNYQSFKADKVVFNAYQGAFIGDTQTINSDMSFYYENLNKGELKVASYIGPIDTHYLENKQNQHLVQLFGFGWFIIGYLGKMIMWLLTNLYAFVPNYGLVCILFAFIIRFFTGPLTKKSFVSNQKMQAIQPKLKKIQTKYKDDAAKLNQEIMNLYKNEGVNPLGGCLPILIQMPLLIALFQVFRKTIEFRGAPFLPFWITDLSQPDVIFQFDFLNEIWGISYFFGHGIALLPIIMGVVMFLNMKMTASTNMNPSQASTMYIMNGFFILLFNTFPSGLNLYYTVYNILNFIQQKKLQKLSS